MQETINEKAKKFVEEVFLAKSDLAVIVVGDSQNVADIGKHRQLL